MLVRVSVRECAARATPRLVRFNESGSWRRLSRLLFARLCIVALDLFIYAVCQCI